MRTNDIYRCDLPIEIRAAIRVNLSAPVAIIADDGSVHVTTYAALDAMMVRVFIETGTTSLYCDGVCIAVNYGRAHGFEPTARSLYVKRMSGRGCPPPQVAALAGLTTRDVLNVLGRKSTSNHKVKKARGE